MTVTTRLPNGVWFRDDTPAEALYRQVWANWLLHPCRGTCGRRCPKMLLADLLDDIQPAIAEGPDDPRWEDFVTSVPGWVSYFQELGAAIAEEKRQRGEVGE